MKITVILLIVLFSLACCVVGIVWTDSCLDYALTEYKGEEVDVNIVVSTLVFIVASPLVLPFNIGCEIHEAYVQ